MSDFETVVRDNLQLALRDHELSKPRHQDPKRLSRHGYKVYSQADEDGIIAEIFQRIGTGTRTFVEFGVENGTECNTLWLLTQGWSGRWIEASASMCESIRKHHRHWLDSGQLDLVEAFLDKNNVDGLVGGSRAGRDIDLLSIDVDFNDYWLWEAIESVNPRVVVMEYNATWPPSSRVTVPYTPDASWDGSNYFGASLGALAALSDRKGYSLVGCGVAGVNAYFVRKDLLGGHFFKPGDVMEHYEPPRYHLGSLKWGHRPRPGPVVLV